MTEAHDANLRARATPPADSPGGDRMGVTLARDAFQMEQEGIRYAPPQAGEREQIARIIRQHVRVDATGLAPAIATVFMVGIEEAAEQIAALPPQAAPGVVADAARYQWLRARDLEAVHEGGVFIGQTPQNLVLNGNDADRAIDAALSAPRS